MSARLASRLPWLCWRSSALRTAASIASSSNGFSRKSAAPTFMASTANATSPCPVTTMTGTLILSSFNRRSRSMPLISGIRTSVMMQPERTSAATFRNATADSYVCTLIFAVPSRNASESRAASSSSMTCTMGPSDGIVDYLTGNGAQREPEDRAAAWIGLATDLPAMGLDDGTGNRQADAHAMRLGGDERLKELGCHLWRHSNAGVGNADGDHSVSGGRS